MFKKKDAYLHNTVGPSLTYPVPCPNIMPIFCQFFYKLVLVWCQFNMVEVKGGRLVSIGHHITRGRHIYIQIQRSCRELAYKGRNNFAVIRLGQLDLLEILLCFLITHTNVATQSQESPVG